MAELTEKGVVDAAAYFEHRHGRRAFTDKNASQFTLGDPSYNAFRDPETQRQQCGPPRLTSTDVNTPHSLPHYPSPSSSVTARPARRPRGPGRDFANFIEQHGFPADASRRSACVDVSTEVLYQYEPNVLHTHKKVVRLPCRSKQCDDNLQLFLRPEEALARAEAQRRLLQSRSHAAFATSRTMGGLERTFHFHEDVHTTEDVRDGEAPKSSKKPFNVDAGRSISAGERQPLPKNSSTQLRERLALLELLYEREQARLEELRSLEEDEESRAVWTSAPHRNGNVGSPQRGTPSRVLNALPQRAAPEEESEIGWPLPPSQRRRRTRDAVNEVCHTADTQEESSSVASVSDGGDGARRVVQPWEREYGQEEENSSNSSDGDGGRCEQSASSCGECASIGGAEDDQRRESGEETGSVEEKTLTQRGAVPFHASSYPNAELSRTAVATPMSIRKPSANAWRFTDVNGQRARSSDGKLLSHGAFFTSSSRLREGERHVLRESQAPSTASTTSMRKEREAKLTVSPQSWTVPASQRASPLAAQPRSRHVLSPSQSPPRHPQHNHRLPCSRNGVSPRPSARHDAPVNRPAVLSPEHRPALANHTPYPSSTVRSLLDLDAERQTVVHSASGGGHRQPQAEARRADPVLTQSMSATTKGVVQPRQGSQTLRDVCRLLNGSL